MIKIDGVLTPKPPYKFDVSLNDLDASAERTASGHLVRDRVRDNVFKVEIGFRGLTPEQYTTLINMIKPASFDFEYPSPKLGTRRTIKAYVSDRKMSAYKYDSATDKIYYESLDFSVIEY